jgi:hypothetical protein
VVPRFLWLCFIAFWSLNQSGKDYKYYNATFLQFWSFRGKMKSDTGASEALMASEEDCDRRKDTQLSKRSYGNDNCTKEEK